MLSATWLQVTILWLAGVAEPTAHTTLRVMSLAECQSFNKASVVGTIWGHGPAPARIVDAKVTCYSITADQMNDMIDTFRITQRNAR